MKFIGMSIMLLLLAVCLCSCSSESGVDCSSLQVSVGKATLKVSPAGDSSYTVQGSNMDGVAGIQLEITYDTASLTTPTVSQGDLIAGAMMAVNTAQPGLIKIAIITTKAFAGSGQIVSITFAEKSGTVGISSLATSMIDSKGGSIATQANKMPASGSGSSRSKKVNLGTTPIVSLVPSGVSSYTVQAVGMDGVAGIQLDIAYDVASLANPTVRLGGLTGGALIAANTSQPGIIKVAMITTSAFSGSGTLAEISFATRTGSGGITVFSSGMVSETGTPIPIQNSYSAPAQLAVAPNIQLPYSSSAVAVSTSPMAHATLSPSCR
jgi:hypothetical protein